MPVRTPEHWQRLDTLLDEALARPADERTAYLRSTCGNDVALYEEVVLLLSLTVEAERALGKSATTYAEPILGPEAASPELPLPTEVGAYRIVREVGRGGMGAVYLAERADGTFEKAVALKLVKRGMDTDEVLARFRRERQILAGLDHPGIARLLDAGAAPDGRPFLAMEYVEGEPVTTYADRNALSLHDRLGLFVQVCEAVQHAHRRLVIHRDLKPSNILVTRDEAGEPRVKLLDFGIARLLDPDSADEALTQTGMRRLTPAYAAPEQVRGEAVTTATDVYALGVILYELLVGQRPLPDPKAPSAVAAPASLSRRLRGDLDTIMLIALREAADERYPSVEALLDDVRRHETGLPLRARPASVRYRVGKFVKRHQSGVAAAALVVLVLVLGLGLTTWQAQEKAREATRADRARDFAMSLFSLADPNEARGQTLTAEDFLDQGAARALDELRDEPEVQEEMLLALAGINKRLSRYDAARSQYEHVLAQRGARLGADDPEVAVAVAGLAAVVEAEGDHAQADSLFQVALAVQRIHGDPLALARTLHTYGELARNQNDPDAAEARQREALVLRQRHAGPASLEVAESLKSLALVQHQRGAYDDAEALYRDALRLQVTLSGEWHPEVSSICNSLASLLRIRGQYPEADDLFRRALAVNRQVYPDGSRAVITALTQWSGLLIERGLAADAQAPAEEAVAMARRLFGERHPSVALAANGLTLSLGEQGRYAEAITRQEVVVAQYEGGPGPDHPWTALALCNLARFQLDQGDVTTAARVYQRVKAIQDAALEPSHVDRAHALMGLGRVALAQQRPEDAEPLLREALTIREAAFGAEHPQTAEVRSWLGACLTAQGRLSEAGPLIEAGARYARGEARQSIQRAIRAHVAAYQAALRS